MAYFMKLSGKYLSTKKKKKEKKKEIEWDEVYILLGQKRFFFLNDSLSILSRVSVLKLKRTFTFHISRFLGGHYH